MSHHMNEDFEVQFSFSGGLELLSQDQSPLNVPEMTSADQHPREAITNTNFYQPDYKGVTLEQFFKSQLQQDKPNNLRNTQASKNIRPKAGVSHDIHNQYNANIHKNDFRQNAFQKRDLDSNKEVFLQRYALQDHTKAQVKQSIRGSYTQGFQGLFTGDDFMRASDGNDYFRRTSQFEGKFFNMKNEITQRFQQQEQELLTKYAHKFNIPPESEIQ